MWANFNWSSHHHLFFYLASDKNNPASKDRLDFLAKSDNIKISLWFELFGASPVFFKACLFTEVAVRRTSWGLENLSFQSRACYFSTCLPERLLLWGGGESTAGGKWHCSSREVGALQSSCFQLFHKHHKFTIVWRVWAKGSGDGERQYQQPWAGAMVYFHSTFTLQYVVCRQGQVAGILCQSCGCIYTVLTVNI